MTGALIYLIDISSLSNRGRLIGFNQGALLFVQAIGPGIGGRPSGGSFAPPTSKSTGATKWVMSDGGGGPQSSISNSSARRDRAPVHGSCLDILSDPLAWLLALGASGGVVYLTRGSIEGSEIASKWVYMGMTFGVYVCAAFIAGFIAAAFFWAGTKSKGGMRFGFTLAVIAVAAAPLALGKLKLPSSSEASSSATASTDDDKAALQELITESRAAIEQVDPEQVEPAPEEEPEPEQKTRALAAAPAVVKKPESFISMSRSNGASISKPLAPRTPGAKATKVPRKPSRTDLQVVLGEVRSFLSEVRNDAASLRERLDEEGLDTILAPTSFAGRTRILDARRRLANIKRITDEYEQNVIDRFESFPDRIRDLNVSGTLKEETVAAFSKSRGEGLKKLREIAQLDRAILSESDKLFSFMESKIGRYKVSDRILFQDVDDAETYNDYIERIQKLAAKEERATVENQKAALSKLAAMERELLDGQ